MAMAINAIGTVGFMRTHDGGSGSSGGGGGGGGGGGVAAVVWGFNRR